MGMGPLEEAEQKCIERINLLHQ